MNYKVILYIVILLLPFRFVSMLLVVMHRSQLLVRMSKFSKTHQLEKIQENITFTIMDQRRGRLAVVYNYLDPLTS